MSLLGASRHSVQIDSDTNTHENSNHTICSVSRVSVSNYASDNSSRAGEAANTGSERQMDWARNESNNSTWCLVEQLRSQILGPQRGPHGT